MARRSAICDLLATLDTGTPLVKIVVGGAEIPVRNFASFNERTEIAVFLNFNGNFEVADCNQISNIEFFNV